MVNKLGAGSHSNQMLMAPKNTMDGALDAKSAMYEAKGMSAAGDSGMTALFAMILDQILGVSSDQNADPGIRHSPYRDAMKNEISAESARRAAEKKSFSSEDTARWDEINRGRDQKLDKEKITDEADKIVNSDMSPKEKQKAIDALRKKYDMSKGDFKKLVTRRLSRIYKGSAKRLDKSFAQIKRQAKSEIAVLEQVYGKDSMEVQAAKAELQGAEADVKKETEQLNKKGETLRRMYRSFWEKVGDWFKDVGKKILNVFAQVLDWVSTALSFIPGLNLLSSVLSGVAGMAYLGAGKAADAAFALAGAAAGLIPGGKAATKVAGKVAKVAAKQAGKNAAKQAAKQGASKSSRAAARDAAEEAFMTRAKDTGRRMRNTYDRVFEDPSEIFGRKVTAATDDGFQYIGAKMTKKGQQWASQGGTKATFGRQVEKAGKKVSEKGSQSAGDAAKQGADVARDEASNRNGAHQNSAHQNSVHYGDSYLDYVFDSPEEKEEDLF